MQILNLINKEKSDIDYSISRFPDGEVQITLGEFSHKDKINVRCRITSAEELFILMQVSDILRRHGMRFSISIYYLMGMRMDRVMSFDRPYTLNMVVHVLDNLGAYGIYLFCPHSSTALDLFRYTSVAQINPDRLDNMVNTTFNDYQIVLPDAGAVERATADDMPEGIVIGEKVRNVTTGKIESIKIKNPEVIDGRPLLIEDDLCDGGGTFVGLAQAIREIDPKADVNIVVCHMVNPKGIENLSKNFNHVWFTNSYKDWKKDWEGQPTPFPKNVTQIDIV